MTGLERREVASLAELAAACAYADHPHLSRDEAVAQWAFGMCHSRDGDRT
jgi:hypothetical protein